MTLPDGWKQGRLGKLCSIEIGGTPSRGVAAYWDSAHDTSNVWVSIRDMRQRLITGSAEQISDLGVKKSNVKLQQPGTVLLSFKLSIGRVAFAAVPLFTNEAIAGLSPTGLTRDFLFYGLQGWDLLQGVDQAIKGATLNKQKLTKILFEYPQSEREQSKIAEVLSTVDRAIEQTEALIAKQQRIKTGLMQDLLTRGIDEHGNLRSEQTHEFKDSPLGRIPVEWEVRDIQSLLANVSSPMRSGPFGSALLKEELVESGVPLLGIDNVFPEMFVPDFRRFVSLKKAAQLHRYRVRPGDLMITIMGTVGRCCVVPENIGEALSSKHIWTLSLNRNLYSPFLACIQINHSPWVHDHFSRDEQGGIMASIRSETLRTTRLPTPPPSEMLRIEQVLRAAADDLQQTKNLKGKVASLKTGLMQDLLTGNRRVMALLE